MPALAFAPSPVPGKTPTFYGARNDVFEVILHEPAGTIPQAPEALVQDVWRTRRYDARALATSDGTPVTVLDPGTHNTDSGPDFRNARLRIGEVMQCGDVEIHTTSSGWFDHKHHLDARYNNVVLHVALHADIWTGGLLRADGNPLPEVILYPHLNASLQRLLYEFYTRPDEVVLCASRWSQVPDAVREPWTQTLALERMHGKKDRLAAAYLLTPDLDALLHEHLFAGLGYAKNAAAMATLARTLPLTLVRDITDPMDLEALHLGVAGLLPAPAHLLQSDRDTADYAMALRDHFEQLQLGLERPCLERTTWHFFRLRPANFPPLRIAQGAAMLKPGGLLHHDPLGKLVRSLQADDPVAALRAALQATPGSFWKTHVRLEKATRPRNPSVGRSRIDALLVNAVVPVLLLYAEQTNDPALEAAVLDVLRRLPPEQDEVTRQFAALGTKPPNALAAQGLHQLYRTRCRHARCLTCPIGRFMLG